jgi:hypothetical protein
MAASAATSALTTGKFLALVATAPIYFASVHGAYYLDENPEPFVVPPNTMLIETVDIGETCYTDMDKLLWDLMQGTNRAKFLTYMKGIPDPADPVSEQKKYMKAFRTVHVYEPGDLVYNRQLTIGGGIDRGLFKKKERTESNLNPMARKTYANMGFYRFPLGSSPNTFPSGSKRTKILEPIRERLVGDEDQYETYESIMQTIEGQYPDDTQGRIFIFGCCGPRFRGTDEQVLEVQKAQRNADLKFKSKRVEHDFEPLSSSERPAPSRFSFRREPESFHPKTAYLPQLGTELGEPYETAYASNEEKNALTKVGNATPSAVATVASKKPGRYKVFRAQANGSRIEVTGSNGGPQYFSRTALARIKQRQGLLVLDTETGEMQPLKEMAGGSRMKTRSQKMRRIFKKALKVTRKIRKYRQRGGAKRTEAEAAQTNKARLGERYAQLNGIKLATYKDYERDLKDYQEQQAKVAELRASATNGANLQKKVEQLAYNIHMKRLSISGNTRAKVQAANLLKGTGVPSPSHAGFITSRYEVVSVPAITKKNKDNPKVVITFGRGQKEVNVSNDILLGTVGDYKFPSFLVPGAAVLLNGSMDKVEAVFSAAEDAKWASEGLLVTSAATTSAATTSAAPVALTASAPVANLSALGSWND